MLIKKAKNGFVVYESAGDMSIYPSLHDMADAIEGPAGGVQSGLHYGNTVYAPDATALNLTRLRGWAAVGRKIDAIKELRNTFEPKLGLKEAKDIIEILCR